MDEVLFAAEIENADWSCVYECEDPSDAWELFILQYMQILDKYAPWRTMYFDSNLPVWIT